MGHTPFYDKIAAVAARGPRFFVPGHKGQAAAVPQLEAFLHWDMTEVDGACDLSHPAEELAQSEANMAGVFGAGASLYSASGSTSCNMAMLALFCGAGGQVVMARGAHVSAARALALMDITPHWVPLRGGLPQAQDVDEALAQSGAGTVYITSVDYYGRIPDVAAIAGVCKKHGARLLCDNAHGAHLKFFAGQRGKSRHPIDLGADAAVDSAHKTLPCLTPAALLHLADRGQAKAAREALNLFCSTSPSYPVLLSLDLAAGQLLDSPPDFAQAAERLMAAAQPVGAMRMTCDDPLRLVLRPALAGVGAQAFYNGLLGAGIAPEFYDGETFVFMASPWNGAEDFEALNKAFKAVLQQPLPAAGSVAAAGGHLLDGLMAQMPETVCGVRQALFGPKQRVDVRQAAGRVCAGLDVPCPPGVPMVLPGQRISPEVAQALLAGGIIHTDVIK